MTPRTGEPSADGRYVVFAPCASAQVRDWLEPHIAVWHGGRWHSSERARDIRGWIGPLPLLKVSDLPREYDL